MDTITETKKFDDLGATPKQIQLFDARLTKQGKTKLAICASIKGTKTLIISSLFLFRLDLSRHNKKPHLIWM
ncbi:hypothetical protein ACQKNB_11785 [Lysinibacillus xylanilyticus]|uniref:hypothetical protein n=1 Tax=Lysinibacillus xylanilyticus TaxID=582475 RepID=UPI003D0221B6